MVEMIINADDFGMSTDVNNAIDVCIKNKYIDRTTIMVNMPCFEEAKQMALAGGYVDKIGLHLNLTEGVPLTEGIKQTAFCRNGLFDNSFFSHTKNRFFLNSTLKKCLRKEIEAQISKFLDNGFSLMHLDSHRHSHNNIAVLKVLIPILQKHGFKTVRICRNIPKQNKLKSLYKSFVNTKIKHHHLNGNIVYFGTMGDYKNFLLTTKKSLKCELMVHPILIDGEIMDSVSKDSIVDWVNEYGRLVIR